VQFPQEGVGQREEMTSSGLYGSQTSYARLPPANTSPNFQDPYATYPVPYGSQPRYGFPAATAGGRGMYGAPNQQTDSSGFQGPREAPQDLYTASGAHTTSTGLNRHFTTGQPGSSEFQTQYSSAGEHMTSPASQYHSGGAQGSSWQPEYRDRYGVYTGEMGSPGVPQHQSALTGQTGLSSFPEPYSTPTANATSPSPQVNLTAPAENPYPDPASPPAQGGMPNVLPATATSRRQSIHQGPGSDRKTSYSSDLAGDVILEVASSKSSKGV
jgi:hypothetical protein